MKMRFDTSRLSLRLALRGTTVVAALFMLVLLAMGGYALQHTVESYDQLFSGPLEMRGITRRMAVAMHNARLHEKAFIARPDPELQQQWEKEVVQVREGLAKLRVLDSRHGHADDIANNDQAVAQLESYRAAFAGVVAAWTTKGFTDKEGLRGNFQGAAADLAAIMGEFDSAEVLIHLNSLRRVEKEWLLHDDAQVITRRQVVLELLHSALTRSTMSHFDKSKIETSIKDYDKAFADFQQARTTGSEFATDLVEPELEKLITPAQTILTQQYVPNLMTELLTARRQEKDYLLTGEERQIKRFKSTIGRLRSNLEQAAHIFPETRKSLLDLLKKYEENLLALVEQDQAIAGQVTVMGESVAAIDKLLNTIVAETEREAQEARDAIQSENQTRVRTAAGVGMVAILLVGVSNFLIGRIVLHQVGDEPKVLAADASRVANGDLTTIITGKSGISAAMREMVSRLLAVSRGAKVHAASIVAVVGQLRAASVGLQGNSNSLREKMRELMLRNDRMNHTMVELHGGLKHVEENSQLTARVADNLTHQMGELASSAHDASRALQTVSTASDQASAKLRVVLGVIERTSGNVGQVAASIEQVDLALGQIKHRCEEANREGEHARQGVRSTRQAIERLQQVAMEIGKAMKLIQRIAEQTNMLALNASIEAATAGEAGVGFAVVAKEVKVLAGQTRDATEIIRGQVEAIGSSTADVATATDGVMAVIERLGGVNGEILEEVRTQSSGLNLVTGTTGEVATEMDQVVRQVNGATDGIEQVNRNVRAVSEQVHRISQLVDQGAEGARSGAAQAADTTNRVIQMSGQAAAMFSVAADNQSHLLKAMELTQFTRGSVRHLDDLVELVSGVAEQIHATQAHFRVGESPLDVQEVKTRHLEWLGPLEHYLETGGTINRDLLPTVEECQFTTWCQVEGRSRFGESSTFSTLEEEHRLLHATLEELVRALSGIGSPGSDPADPAARIINAVDPALITTELDHHRQARARFFNQLDALVVEG